MDRRDFQRLPIEEQRALRARGDANLAHARAYNDLRAKCPCASCSRWRQTPIGKAWVEGNGER